MKLKKTVRVLMVMVMAMLLVAQAAQASDIKEIIFARQFRAIDSLDVTMIKVAETFPTTTPVVVNVVVNSTTKDPIRVDYMLKTGDKIFKSGNNTINVQQADVEVNFTFSLGALPPGKWSFEAKVSDDDSSSGAKESFTVTKAKPKQKLVKLDIGEGIVSGRINPNERQLVKTDDLTTDSVLRALVQLSDLIGGNVFKVKVQFLKGKYAVAEYFSGDNSAGYGFKESWFLPIFIGDKLAEGDYTVQAFIAWDGEEYVKIGKPITKKIAEG